MKLTGEKSVLSCFLYVLVLAARICQGLAARHQSLVSRRSTAHESPTEVTLSHRLKQFEKQLLQTVEDRHKERNESALLRNLQRRLHRLVQEVASLRKQEAHKSKTIAQLKRQIRGHQPQAKKLQEAVSSLGKLTEDLQVRVAALEESRGSIPSTSPPYIAKDCQDALRSGVIVSPGLHFIDIQPTGTASPFGVSCKIQNNTGWTLLQRRQDGSVDFYRTWQAYKNGFGQLRGEFWLGNDHIYHITNQGEYKLRIEMRDFNGKEYWAEYQHFRISDESDKYRLHVHDYQGNAGDSLTARWEDHNDQPFSTKDRDNDARFYDNCAHHFKGAWWFKSCFESHLNGLYYQKGEHSNYFQRNGVIWRSVHLYASLEYVSMMVAPNKRVHQATNAHINGIS